MTDLSKVVPVHIETGEVVDDIVMYSKDTFQQRKEFFAKQDAIDVKARSDAGFVFYQYREPAKLCISDLQASAVSRLFQLATYTRYRENALMKTQRTPMYVRDIKEVLSMGKSNAYPVLREMCEKGYLRCEKKRVYLNGRDFVRGDIQDESMYYFTRLYVKPMQALYKSATLKQHSFIGHIFMLIPFLNMSWNVVCYNPFERDWEHVRPIKIGDICDILGYSRSNAYRWLHEELRIKFLYNDQMQRLISVLPAEKRADRRIMVNPNVLYAGYEKAQVMELGQFVLDPQETGANRR